MTAPLVEQVDPEQLLTDYLYPLTQPGGLAQVSGWSVGTVVKAGATPINAIRVRVVGGTPEAAVADRPRLDVRLWGSGDLSGVGVTMKAARVLIAHLRRDLRAQVVLDPVALPDAADSTRSVVMFTIELLTRGTQS